MIHLITTSANVESMYDLRKTQYIKGLESIYEFYKLDPYIIETVKSVDYLPKQYLGSNTYSINKSNNEFINIENFLKSKSNFQDDDFIIKMTLRYQLYSSIFLNIIKQNENYDIFCKPSKDIYGPNDIGVHTFLFCMKLKMWKLFFSDYFDRTTHKDFPIEVQISNFIRNKNVLLVNELGIYASPWNHKTIYKT